MRATAPGTCLPFSVISTHNAHVLQRRLDRQHTLRTFRVEWEEVVWRSLENIHEASHAGLGCRRARKVPVGAAVVGGGEDVIETSAGYPVHSHSL